MRLSTFCKVSFVGALMFSPAMAQEAEQMHEEALRLLRSQTDGAGTASNPAAEGAQNVNEAARLRAEREARLKAEAHERLAERDRIQAEKARQFEEYVKERERLRQPGQNPAAVVPAPGSPVHDAALEVLRHTDSHAAGTPSTHLQQTGSVAPVAPIHEAEFSPRIMASSAVAQNTDETHERALDVLRQQMRSAPAGHSGAMEPAASRALQPVAAPIDAGPRPSPELQRRLDEIERELNAPAPRPGRQPANPQADEVYTRELEQRALELMQNRSSQPARAIAAPATTPPVSTPAITVGGARVGTSPALDPQTREILRRQDQEISQHQGTSIAAPQAPRSPVYSGYGLSPDAEARAREILRQQQQAVGTIATVPAQPAMPSHGDVSPVAPITPSFSPPSAPVSSSPFAGQPLVQDGRPAEYSRELEDRARQIIIERQQAGSNFQPVPSASVQDPRAAATAAASATAGRPDQEVGQIHSRALETLHQVRPGAGHETLPGTKQERIRALTELYMQDKISPAEYHQRRAQILAEGR